MTATMNLSKKVLLPLVTAGLAVGLVIWLLLSATSESPPERTGSSFDMPIYSSLDELAAASDAQVVGTVKGTVAHEIDYGTADPAQQVDQAGIPVVFYEVAVSETLEGTTGDTVIVAAPDVEQLNFSSEITSLRAGERVLLFLREQTAEDAPGIDTYDFFYVPVSLDNGVFDVLPGDIVRPRMPDAFVPTAAEVESVPTFTLDEVRQSG